MLLSGHGIVKGLASAFLGGVLSSVLTLVSGLFSPNCLLRLESNIRWTFLNSSFFILLTRLALFPQYHYIFLTLCVHLFRSHTPSGHTRSLI